MPAPLLHLVARLHVAALLLTAPADDADTDAIDTDPSHTDGVRDRGQATTEYALIMLAAALVALLVVAWATAGGGAGKIGKLFDRVIDSVLDKV